MEHNGKDASQGVFSSNERYSFSLPAMTAASTPADKHIDDNLQYFAITRLLEQ